MSQGDEKRKLTPPDVAKLWGVSPDKVIAWIRSGELKAIDASRKPGKRPRYLIDVADLREFEERRATSVHRREQDGEDNSRTNDDRESSHE